MTLAELAAKAADEQLSIEDLQALDVIYESARAQRLAHDRASANFKKEEDQANALLLTHIMRGPKTFVRDQMKIGFEGPIYVPHVDDWEKFQAHIIAMEDLSLLEKRVSKAAILERWEAGSIVPGIEQYPTFKVTREKVKTNG